MVVPEIVCEPPPVIAQPPPLPEVEPLRFVDYHTASLEQLQQEGLVRKRIAEKTVASLPRTPWHFIARERSDLLTNEGIEKSVYCEDYLRLVARVQKLDLRAMAQRNPTEKEATEKQLNFLRTLGVTDEQLLAELGIRQASTLIDFLLENKDLY